MPIRTAIGFSSENDVTAAFRNAAVMARNQASFSNTGIVLVLTTPSHPLNTPNCLEPLNKIFNPARMIGVTAPELILPDGNYDRGVAICTMAEDDIDISVALQESVSIFPLQQSGISLAQNMTAGMRSTERHGALVFCNTVDLNHNLFIRGLQERLGSAFLFNGVINPGMLVYNNRCLNDAALGILFGGASTYASSIRHGWQPLGKPRIITDCSSNLIRRIDNKPAASLYQEYLPEEFAQSASGSLGNIGLLYPLGLNTPSRKEYIIKIPSSVLPDGSLVCQGDISPGSQVHLMIGDKDACRKAAHDAATDVLDKLHGKQPKLALVFASIARKNLFGRTARQEINKIKEIFGLSCPVFGMYTYGEIGPAGRQGHTGPLDIQTHNASILITAIG